MDNCKPVKFSGRKNDSPNSHGECRQLFGYSCRCYCIHNLINREWDFWKKVYYADNRVTVTVSRDAFERELCSADEAEA